MQYSSVYAYVFLNLGVLKNIFCGVNVLVVYLNQSSRIK
jgi:hypothetical protein